MYYILQIVHDKNILTFNPGLEGRSPWVALCRNTSSVYSYTMQLMGSFLPNQGLMVVLYIYICFFVEWTTWKKTPLSQLLLVLYSYEQHKILLFSLLSALLFSKSKAEPIMVITGSYGHSCIRQEVFFITYLGCLRAISRPIWMPFGGCGISFHTTSCSKHSRFYSLAPWWMHPELMWHFHFDSWALNK